MCRAGALLRRRAKVSGKVGPPVPAGNKGAFAAMGEKASFGTLDALLIGFVKMTLPDASPLGSLGCINLCLRGRGHEGDQGVANCLLIGPLRVSWPRAPIGHPWRSAPSA
jgi:hypothetical protein